MNVEKKDLRYQKNHQRILDAFSELIISRNYEDITVKEICEKAEVNRSTFYDHFNDKWKVVDELYSSIMELFADSIVYCLRVEDDGENILRHLHQMSDHKKLVKIALKNENEHVLKRAFTKRLEVRIQELNISFREPDFQLLYVRIASSIALEIMRWWSATDRKNNEYVNVKTLIRGILYDGMNKAFFAS